MTSSTGLIRIAVILLFIITFTAVGWAAPALYASHAPEGEFIEVHSFTAENVTESEDSHLVCFDRTMETSTTGKVFTELYLVTEDGLRVEASTQSMDRYFQEGHHRVVTPMEVPETAAPGTYKYLLVVEMELADGRVTRSFVYESDKFVIRSENGVESESIRSFSC